MNSKETANSLFDKLPFRALAEKIPAEMRARVPLLAKAIPCANQIVCGAAAALAAVVITVSVSGGGADPASMAKRIAALEKKAERYALEAGKLRVKLEQAEAAGGTSRGADFGDFPFADVHIYPTNFTPDETYTLEDLYGPNAPFATTFQDKPCRVTIESSSGKDAGEYDEFEDETPSEFTATLLLEVQTAEGVWIDGRRLTVHFLYYGIRTGNYPYYVKLEVPATGEVTELRTDGSGRSEDEITSLFAEAIDIFWDFSTIPAAVQGTWVRTGKASGRDYDTTAVITGSQMEFTYSNGSSSVRTVNRVRADTNSAADSGEKKAAEYPSGWRIQQTTTAVTGNLPQAVGGREVGEEVTAVFFMNAAKNKMTQNDDDVKDIFVKK